MKDHDLKPGDLVIIRNQDVVESFVRRGTLLDETLLGVLIDLEIEDPDSPREDIWIVLVNEQPYKMLRWEFEPCNKSGRVVV